MFEPQNCKNQLEGGFSFGVQKGTERLNICSKEILGLVYFDSKYLQIHWKNMGEILENPKIFPVLKSGNTWLMKCETFALRLVKGLS